MLKWKAACAATVAACLTSGLALAQAPATGQPGRETRQEERQQNQSNQQNREERREQRQQRQGEVPSQQRTDAARQSTHQSLDQTVADCLLLGNHEEIALAKMAKENAESEDVKKFAQMLIEDHQKFVQKLQKFSSRSINLDGDRQADASTPQTDSLAADQRNRQAADRPAEPRQTLDQNGRPVEHRAAYAPQGDEARFQLEQAIAKECLHLTKKELKEHSGKEFDMAFVGQQMGAHIGMTAKLKASRSFVSADLQQVLDEGLQVTMQHHEKAKQLKDKLKDSKKDSRDERQSQSR